MEKQPAPGEAERAAATAELTLPQIAEAAGVSLKTASLALRGHPFVAKETAARVQKVADEFGYASRKPARRKVIGVGLAYIEHQDYAALAAEIRSCANGLGLLTLISETVGEPTREARVIAEFSRRGVDGIILISPRSAPEDIHRLCTARQPIVTVGRPIEARERFGFSSVEIDHESGALAAVRHLVEKGHSRIGYLGGRLAATSELHRHAGYQRGLKEAGLPYAHERVTRMDQSASLPDAGVGYRQCKQLLAGLGKNPLGALDGLLVYNDILALGALKSLSEAGLRVPEDISVIGFDNLPFGEYLTPPLTSVAPSRSAVAARAFGLLRDHMETPTSTPVRPRRETVPSQLIHRGSVFDRRSNRQRHSQ